MSLTRTTPARSGATIAVATAVAVPTMTSTSYRSAARLPPGGQIHVMVRTPITEREGQSDTGSVTGGTGAYAGAHGTLTSTDRGGTAGGDPSDDTITLLP